MRSSQSDPLSSLLARIGTIVVASGSSQPVDSLYLQRMNSAVSARSFNERFSASGQDYAVSGCRLGSGRQETGRVTVAILVSIRPLGPKGENKERSLEDSLAPVTLWLETALATLIENSAGGDEDAVPPALMEISYDRDVGQMPMMAEKDLVLFGPDGGGRVTR